MGLFDKASGASVNATSSSKPQEVTGKGLLFRVAKLERKEDRENFESVCIERVLHLPLQASVEYTALSLIKAYYPFSAGIILGLKGAYYESFASIGLETSPHRFPVDFVHIESNEKALQIGNASTIGINVNQADEVAWAFPLDNNKPCTSLLILALGPTPSFDIKSLSHVVNDCRSRLSIAQIAPKEADTIKKYVNTLSLPTLLLILERLNVLTENTISFEAEAKKAAGTLASVYPLQANRILVSIKQEHDSELIAHRLSKTLSSKILSKSLVQNVDSAYDFVQSFL